MLKKIKYGTTLIPKTISQMKEIADLYRWNENDVIEIAIDKFHAQIMESKSNSNNPANILEIQNK